MTIKGLVRPVPGVRRLSLLRQRIGFADSADFWQRRYALGGTSGGGSYGALGEGKARFLNSFVRDRGLASVIEFGCGDGHQLSLAEYPSYVGLDVSPAAIAMCKERFSGDPDKSFFLYHGDCFVDSAGLFRADLSISLDVVYHLVEDHVFSTYMFHLFQAAVRHVIIYATNAVIQDTAPHVRHRQFATWVAANCPQWELAQVWPGPNSGPARADFYCYERAAREGR